MKTTLKLDGGKSLSVQPSELSVGLNFTIAIGGFSIGAATMTEEMFELMVETGRQALNDSKEKAQAAA